MGKDLVMPNLFLIFELNNKTTKMKQVTYIALFDVEEFDNPKGLAEQIKNEKIEVDFASGCEYEASFEVKNAIVNKLGLTEEDKEFIQVLSISDFMDAYNNEEINEVGTFMTYVNVTIKTK